jgi:hypothetical protein
MSVQRFVCGVSLVLLAWLGFTFVREVPASRYPKLEKVTDSAPAKSELEPVILPVSVSR